MPDISSRLGLRKPLSNEAVTRAAYNENIDIIDQNAAKTSDLTAHLAESMIHAAGGTANAPVVATGGDFKYVQGAYLKFKATADNTGSITINIDGKGIKPLKKMDGSQIPAGGIKSGKVYEVYFDVAGDCFFLLARAEGNAVAGDVLAGKTFSNGDDTGIIGSVPNQGQKILTPETSNIAIPAGYHDGTGYVVGDANLVTGNIKSGANIFGVAGNSNVVDTSPGTAVAGDILSGKIAIVGGSQLTGTMANRGAYNITPGVSNITIPAGYHNGSGVVYGVSVNHSSQTFNSSGTFTVSSNIFRILVALWGGGGGGSYNGDPYNAFGGGGGGFTLGWINVTPGQQLTVAVGTGGAKGNYLSSNGGNGGNSSVGSLIAYGGEGGVCNSRVGNGGCKASSVAGIVSSFQGTTPTIYAYGGGAAGPAGEGTNNLAGGAFGDIPAGGNGGVSSTVGTAPGGGGGGGPSSGADGASGRVIIFW